METLLQGLYKASLDENEQVVRQVTPYILQSANFPLEVATETKELAMDRRLCLFTGVVKELSQNLSKFKQSQLPTNGVSHENNCSKRYKRRYRITQQVPKKARMDKLVED